jgi:enoyl-CoA hydratase
MQYESLEYEVTEKVAHITLSRPEALNSLTPAFWSELPQLIRELDNSGEVRAAVLASTGKHFSAGMDLAVFQAMPDQSELEAGRARAALMRNVVRLQEALSCLEDVRFPVLAAVQGGCIGGGVDIISACDMRYCTADAFYCIQEINLGIVADLGTFPRLSHLIPHGLVRELAYTGRRLDAEEALRAGFVNKVYDDHETLLDGVRQIALEIASKSPLAVWGSKEVLNYGRDHTVADSLRHMAVWQSGMLQDTDLKAAMTAQQRKQQAQFEDLLPLDQSMI